MRSLKRLALRMYLAGARLYLEPLLRREARSPLFPKNERAVEFAYAFEWLARLSPNDLLDVGTGKTAFPHLAANCGIQVTAIDEVRSYWRDAFFNRHWWVVNQDILRPDLPGRYDVITCLSTLEHIVAHDRAVDAMFRLMRPGGHLILTCPYNEARYVPNAYALPEATSGRGLPFVCQVLSRHEIDGWLIRNRGVLVDQRYFKAFTGAMWGLGNHIHPLQPALVTETHHLTCLVIRNG